MSAFTDERTIEGKDRLLGFLGPVSSSFTLAWLASHRQRLRTFILGGPRLSILVIWDRQGNKEVNQDTYDVAAIRTLTYGAWEDQ